MLPAARRRLFATDTPRTPLVACFMGDTLSTVEEINAYFVCIEGPDGDGKISFEEACTRFSAQCGEPPAGPDCCRCRRQRGCRLVL
jgi:hypothetical protein